MVDNEPDPISLTPFHSIEHTANYQRLRNAEARLRYLQKTVRDRSNVFAALMEAVKSYSLGQSSHALYGVGDWNR